MYRKFLNLVKYGKHTKKIIIAMFMLAIFMVFKESNQPRNDDSNLILVETSKAEKKDFPIFISSIGNVEPNLSANLVAQISGKIAKIKFSDGQKVKKNDIIVELECASFKAQLDQYKGQLLRDQALLDNAKLDLLRYEELWKQNSVSKQTLDTQTALVKQYEGNVQIDQGLVDNAQVNVNYCNIIAPFDGQMGLKQQSEGNMAVANQTIVGVINNYNPISVIFSVPEVQLGHINQEFLASKNMRIYLYDQNGKNFIKEGELKAVDNQIDLSTGTVKLKAEFDNEDSKLFPNQFVNVRLKIKTYENIVVIPVSAVNYNTKGSYVYKDHQGVAKLTYIDILDVNDKEVVIKTGVEEGELVIISGLDKLIDGSKIKSSNNDVK